ncbi:hypothetical protein ABE10_31580, partial [Bacillus toyonensis]|nr:hypothetical protein [Bacillus toyonensis]
APAAQHRLLDLGDGLGDLDATGARLGAVEGRPAAPDALLVVEDVETDVCRVVARVEDEAVRVHDGGRAEVLSVGPEHRAGRGARRAEDALGGVVEALAIGDRLGALLALLRGRTRDEERLHLAVRGEERLHVDDEVLLQRQALDGLDVDRLGDVQVLDQRLARETIATVDAHRIRTADAVRTGPAEAQRAVDLPLDLVQRIEHAVGRVHLDVVVHPVRFGVDLRVEPSDDEGDQVRLHTVVVGGLQVGDGVRVDESGGHQYFLSIGG